MKSNSRQAIGPGRIAGTAERLSNTQWFLNRSKHIVYMVFLVPGRLEQLDCVQLINDLSTAFPRLAYCVDLEKSEYFHSCDSTIDSKLEALSSGDLPALLKSLLEEMTSKFEPGLQPTVHCTMAYIPDRSSTMLFFSAPHAAFEGMDALRIRHASSTGSRSFGKSLTRFLMSVSVLPLSASQLVIAPLLAKPRRLFCRRVVSLDKKAFRRTAKANQVSWQSLLLACVATATSGTISRRFSFPLTLAVTEVPGNTSGNDDASISFRMRFGMVRQSTDLVDLARKCDRRLFSERKYAVTLYSFISAGLSFHRRLASLLPRLYPERSFQYFPADLSFSIMPPIRKRRFGVLTHASLIAAGSNTPGLKSCIVVSEGTHLTLSLNLSDDSSQQVARLEQQFQLLGIEMEILV